MLRRRLGETKPETCTQIAQANKQAQDAGHALRRGEQAWEQQQQCEEQRMGAGGNDDEEAKLKFGQLPKAVGAGNR